MLSRLSSAILHAAFHYFRVGSLFSLDHCPLLPAKQGSTNLLATSSPQLAPVTPSCGVGSRCRPARVIVRAVTATKHEPGLSPLHRVVSYGSALGDRALLMRLLSYHQSARGEAFAVVPPCEPPARQWRQARPQQSPNSCCTHRTSITDSEPVNVSGDPENSSHIRSISKRPSKCFISGYIRLCDRAAVAPLRVGCSVGAARESCDTEDPATFVDNPSFVCVARHQCDSSVFHFLRCRFLFTSPPSSLDPRLASEALPAANVDSRDKSNGDGRDGTEQP